MLNIHRTALADEGNYMNQLEAQLYPLILGRGFKFTRFQLPHAIFAELPQLEKHFNSFYRMMKKYAFRLLLHDLLSKLPQCAVEDLTHYCSAESVKRFLPELKKIGIIKAWDREKIYQNTGYNFSTGWILEWFITVLLARVFQAPSLFNVGLSGTKTGGDYDILSAWMGKLLYIEAKSAPPKGIHNPEIGAFLQRIFSLKPHLAIFIVDTHLRVKDKIVLMFEEELIKLLGVESLKTHPLERVEEQIFHLHHYIYIMNSKRSFERNFSTIFHDYLQNNLPLHRIL